MGKTAIVLGVTGLTGQFVLNKLITDERYETIKLFSRKKTTNLSPKIIEYVGNLLELETFKNDFTGDEVYCCIGTTAKKTSDKVLYKKIDFGIPVEAAKLAKTNTIETYLVVSSMGANPKSNIFYNRTKGEMEQGILNEKIKNTYILRPSIINGKRNENRSLEKLGLAIFKIMQPLFIGNFKKYRIIDAEKIAQAMLNLANLKPKNMQIIPSDKIEGLCNCSK